MKKLYLLLAVMSLNTVAYADENPYLPESKLKDAKVSTWNVGAGFTKKLLHGNVEWVNPYGIAYAKAGVFLNDDARIVTVCVGAEDVNIVTINLYCFPLSKVFT